MTPYGVIGLLHVSTHPRFWPAKSKRLLRILQYILMAHSMSQVIYTCTVSLEMYTLESSDLIHRNCLKESC